MMQKGDLEPLNDDVDRRQLARIKQYFLALNQERFLRTLTSLSDRQKHFLELIPLFFHVNHPMLPGYAGHQTPSGVQDFSPSKQLIHIATCLARSFIYHHDLQDKQCVIEALFMMGSSGTVAHSDSSDIDVWVCHSSNLNPTKLLSLQEKCLSLTHWAAEVIHLEAHFFLMDAQQFIQGQQPVFNSEASGTAQHFLLLDEFYRSAIWLAGKTPLWWFVPTEKEHLYSKYSQNLLQKRFLRSSDVIDFGGIPSIPTNEFVGAGIWQLYKGIDSPYKSILKLLLLEAYTEDQFCEPLSLEFKRKIYSIIATADNNFFKTNNKLTTTTHTSIYADELDAYVLVYKRLESYLLFKNQQQRLELVRRCFYFKVGENLSSTRRSRIKTWQFLLMQEMLKAWMWPYSQLTLLDNRVNWKAAHVIKEHNLLAKELTQGYQLLLSNNQNTENNAAISSQELNILGRKLHAEFEPKSGKIDWINPNISLDLTEPNLFFVQTTEDDHYRWKVFCGSQQDVLLTINSTAAVKHSHNFIEAIVWCHVNEIFSINTKLDIVSHDFVLLKSQRQLLLQAIKNWFPLPILRPKHDCFTKNSQLNSIHLLFNVGIEPQLKLHKKGLQMLSNQADALGYSGLKENLILRVDIVHSNTWGEIICRHIESDALINCLLYYLRSIPPQNNPRLPELTIHCFNIGQGNMIEQRMKDLWQAINNCFYSTAKMSNARFIFEMAGEYCLLHFIQRQPRILRFKRYSALLNNLSTAQTTFSRVVVDGFALPEKSLHLIFTAITIPGAYLFYKIEGKQVDISIVDHKGSLFLKTFRLFNMTILLRNLCRFMIAVIERLLTACVVNTEANRFANETSNIIIYEIVGDKNKKKSHLQLRNIDKDISKLSRLSICAIAELTENNQMIFSLICDGKKFTAVEFGAQLFAVVARHILSFRHFSETYPCYITDLDLSLCEEYIAPHTGMQLIHYLTIKTDVEQRLNTALQHLKT